MAAPCAATGVFLACQWACCSCPAWPIRFRRNGRTCKGRPRQALGASTAGQPRLASGRSSRSGKRPDHLCTWTCLAMRMCERVVTVVRRVCGAGHLAPTSVFGHDAAGEALAPDTLGLPQRLSVQFAVGPGGRWALSAAQKKGPRVCEARAWRASVRASVRAQGIKPGRQPCGGAWPASGHPGPGPPGPANPAPARCWSVARRRPAGRWRSARRTGSPSSPTS